MDSGFDLLIGNNIAYTFTPLDIKESPCGAPYATKAMIGWIIWNHVRNSDCCSLSVNTIQFSAVERLDSDRKLEQMFQKSLNINCPERRIDDTRKI